MPKVGGAQAARAKQVWRALFDLLIRSAPSRTESLARRGLTPNDSRALFSLDPSAGRSMRSLADEWHCDPSNATWIVDHLEELGLARRAAVPHDRRVTHVLLTGKGQKARTQLLDEFHQPPPDFARLDRADLDALDRVLTIPLSFGALITGVLLGLGTKWGVFRYPWVTTKLLLIVSVMLVGGLIIRPTLDAILRQGGSGVRPLIGAAADDVAALALATILSVFKPGRAFKPST